MIGLEDRQALAQDIQTAHSGGARLRLACATAGIDERTLQRWKAQEGDSQALAGLLKRGMDLQVLVQDGVLQLIDGDTTLEITPRLRRGAA